MKAQIPKVKIGIVGYGFVGKATDSGFCRNVEKFIVDPKINTTIDELAAFEPEFIFVCVPTPMGNDGQQNYEIIENVANEIFIKCTSSIKIIKSTVLPSILSKLKEEDDKLVYNPEFLREKHAEIDFAESPMIILGGDQTITKKVSKLYANNSICSTNEYVYVDIETASLIKYCINTFLALKVVFFNEIFHLFKDLNTSDSWNKFIHSIALDKRVGESHMDVPGHDGKFGFGGACFPKDSAALLKFAQSRKIDLNILEAAVKKNNKIRSEYPNLDIRESEQNITFDDKV